MLDSFSKINTDEELFEVIHSIHETCYSLVKISFGQYFANAGNIGVFTNYDDEYANLLEVKDSLTRPSKNPNQKYFELLQPIIIEPRGDIPRTIYTHLYIRKPDPSVYGSHLGDIDFYVSPEKYEEMVTKVRKGEVKQAELYEQPGVGTLIEMTSPKANSLAYLSTKETTEKIRVKYS